MWLEFAQMAHLPVRWRRPVWRSWARSDASLNPLRKCVHQCKQRKFTPAPQICVYVGATSLGCGAAWIFFFSSPFRVCVSWTEFFFFHMTSRKQTNRSCCYWWSAGCISWLNHRGRFGWKGILSCYISVVSYCCWGNLLSLLRRCSGSLEFGQLVGFCNKQRPVESHLWAKKKKLMVTQKQPKTSWILTSNLKAEQTDSLTLWGSLIYVPEGKVVITVSHCHKSLIKAEKPNKLL